jgi:hypothetical protein
MATITSGANGTMLPVTESRAINASIAWILEFTLDDLVVEF